jgi:chromosome segregation ATPase
MKIKKIELTGFKRFTHLTIERIPETARLVIVAGPNGMRALTKIKTVQRTA